MAKPTVRSMVYAIAHGNLKCTVCNCIVTTDEEYHLDVELHQVTHTACEFDLEDWANA